MTKEHKAQVEISLENIRNKLSEYRFEHTKRVLRAALELAEINNADLEKVKKAALLHDIAKKLSRIQIKELLNDSGWEIDELEWSLAAVLHAPAGAELARIEYGVNDYDILEAIRYHTLGHPEMGITAQIIYAADFIEEGRNFEGLKEIQKTVKDDLSKGIYLITSNSIKYQIDAGNPIHSYTNRLRNKFLVKRSDN